MSTDISLHKAQADLAEAGELLRGFYQPWDADDSRPLNVLRDAVEAQQRALATLLLLVESDRKINAAARARFTFAESLS